MSERASSIIQGLILVAIGAVLVLFFVQGRIVKYLTQADGFQPLALAAGIGLLMVGIFLVITSNRAAADCGHDHDHDHDHGHNHGHGHGHDHDHDHGQGDCCSGGGCSHGQAEEESAGDHGHDHSDGEGCVECDHDHAGHHDHHHGETWAGMAVTAAILLVPLVAGAAFSPDRYSDHYIANNRNAMEQGPVGAAPEKFDLRRKAEEARDTATSGGGEADEGGEAAAAAGWGKYTLEDFQQQVDRNADGDYLLDVVSIFYTGGDEEVQDVVEGLPIETIGQVTAETLRDPNKQRARVFRLLMNCCIADARPVSVPVDFGGPVPSFREMGWYKIRGKMSYEQWDDFTIPVITEATMQPTKEPTMGTMGQRD